MKILMLNQKSKMRYSQIETYVTKLRMYSKNFIIFPSNIYVSKFTESGFQTGIQNIAENDRENQTGEITANQAKSAGIKYCIIGHSERRTNQFENSEILLNKFNEALNAELNIVYCVGETLVEYKMNETNNVIYNELDDIFSKIDKSKIKNLYIAYEPLWAIGSGITPTSIEIDNVSKYIKGYLDDKNIKGNVLYGGSVNDENIDTLIQMDSIDGFLVGGASNDHKKVEKMIGIVNKTTK